jgi:hypothetical protein
MSSLSFHDLFLRTELVTLPPVASGFLQLVERSASFREERVSWMSCSTSSLAYDSPVRKTSSLQTLSFASSKSLGVVKLKPYSAGASIRVRYRFYLFKAKELDQPVDPNVLFAPAYKIRLVCSFSENSPGPLPENVACWQESHPIGHTDRTDRTSEKQKKNR